MNGYIGSVQRDGEGHIEVLEAYVNRGGRELAKDIIKHNTCYKLNDASETLYNVIEISKVSAKVPSGKLLTVYQILLKEKNGDEEFPVVSIKQDDTRNLSMWIPCPTFGGDRRRTRRYKRKAKKTRKSRSNNRR
jgi:hypothetical protein